MRHVRCPHEAITVAILLSLTSSALARSGGPSAEDRWNPQHVSVLPVEIQNAIVRMCGQSMKAEHAFTSYFENSRRILLHFEHVRCGTRGPLCTQAGCLHQVYVSAGGHYRLVRSYYAPEGD
jgi:hypothetical protein